MGQEESTQAQHIENIYRTFESPTRAGAHKIVEFGFCFDGEQNETGQAQPSKKSSYFSMRKRERRTHTLIAFIFFR
jgi:hypothetical protein